MKSAIPKRLALIALLAVLLGVFSGNEKPPSDMNIVFLHHSTGAVIWKGDEPSLAARAANKLSPRLAESFAGKARLPLLFENHNRDHNTSYRVDELSFPKAAPYGWHNYPYDYFNLWVKHAGDQPFMEEPTLEMLTRRYQVIIFKHCFPVCNIQAGTNAPEINSDCKTLANYKLQYLALREKMHQFSGTKFIVLTGAAQVKACATEDEAGRAAEFFRWVTGEWDLPGDNIFVWDLYKLQTEDGLYFKDSYARSANDSHPNGEFAARAVQLFFNRIIDVIESGGSKTTLTGERR